MIESYFVQSVGFSFCIFFCRKLSCFFSETPSLSQMILLLLTRPFVLPDVSLILLTSFDDIST